MHACTTLFKSYKSNQFSSVAQSCPTLCDPMNCSTPGLPVHYQLLEFTQTHVHRVGDAIQPSHPLGLVTVSSVSFVMLFWLSFCMVFFSFALYDKHFHSIKKLYFVLCTNKHETYDLRTIERLHFHFSLSCIGEGNYNPLQCSCLENPRDGRAW